MLEYQINRETWQGYVHVPFRAKSGPFEWGSTEITCGNTSQFTELHEHVHAADSFQKCQL